MSLSLVSLADEVADRGFARRGPAQIRELIPAPDAVLEDFAESWQRLETDGFMRDGGRYRLRRLANFLAVPGVPGHLRGLHRPHFQEVVHNTLNGGLDRWFAPVEDETIANPFCQGLLDLGREVADRLHPGTRWFVEMHQFRVQAQPNSPGHPTPEGVHHDGTDVVLIAMVARTNLLGGETMVTDGERRTLARFTLNGLLDLTILDDRRVMHGVTPVEPADPALPSCRDVLVLTWKRVD
ncbi:2OG-Fe dioxygenase family protein [Roseococcus sp. YIM B11640]|uniref:2OG-Fe dioxygenase family protein n=1 Tax=Roseococcus sp. YIM B11640 TaxID=3133973 RepID=UPI003C7E5864